MIGLVESLQGWVEGLLDGAVEFMGDLISAIAKSTYHVPHPQLEKPADLFTQPDAGIWAELWAFHWNQGVPIGITILIGMWFLRTAGSATGILATESKVRADKNIITGIVGVIMSYHIAVIYLNLAHALTVALAPSSTEFEAIASELAITAGAGGLIFYFFTVSLNVTIMVLLLIVNIARIIAIFAIPMLAWFYATMYYAEIPMVTPMVTDVGKKVAKAALWTIPTAAAWRVMFELISADGGIIGAISGGIDNGAISGLDQLLSSFVFILPLIIGILAPLLMSNVSQLYYLNRMAGLSIGKDKDSDGDGDDNDGSGNGDDGSGSGSNGKGGSTGSGTPPGGGGGGGGGSKPVVSMPVNDNGKREIEFPAAKERIRNPGDTAHTIGGTAKSKIPGLDEDQEYIDWENVERTKRRGRKVAGGFGTAAGVVRGKLGGNSEPTEAEVADPSNSIGESTAGSNGGLETTIEDLNEENSVANVETDVAAETSVDTENQETNVANTRVYHGDSPDVATQHTQVVHTSASADDDNGSGASSAGDGIGMEALFDDEVLADSVSSAGDGPETNLFDDEVLADSASSAGDGPETNLFDD